ncbi:GGDEF domain-containing protein [Marinobacterium sp. YM272]|uniref:GGDEF domain-containing protein n=1 Tax=Marinobacterium sp. YM272 TaxID=3421654 RepID=UPI003D7FBB9B
MDPLVIYYTHGAEEFAKPVQALVEQAGLFPRWEPCDSIGQVPVGALVLLNDTELNQPQQRLLASRRAIVLADDAAFETCTGYLAQGALSCIQQRDAERIALELIALESQQQRSVAACVGNTMLQTVIDAIPVPIFFKDEHHIYRGCNIAFSEAMGRPLNRIVGHSVYDMAPAELADRYHRADRELLAAGGHQRYESPVRYADGQLHNVEFHKAVYYHGDGRPAGQVGAMLDITERKQLIDQLERSSRTDPLTGVGNRREFNQVAREAIKQHCATGQPLSLLVLDVDYFKSINDRFGHAVGDRALKFLVQQCASLLREEDHLFRVGGEEFYMLLQRTGVKGAEVVAKRLVDAVREASLIVEQSVIRMTVSVGVVDIALDTPLEESLARGDKALYKAKRDGRDRACIAAS